jgi:hypothetical protein
MLLRGFFMQTIFGSVALAFAIAACGGSNLDPGAGNDAGKGTGTLAIEGSVHASPRLTNARVAAEFDTDFSVRVALNNQTVTTGTVTVTSSTGKVPLTYRNDNRWAGSVPGYDEVYILDVESGPDKVTGVRVDGPDIHVFSTPTAGATVDSTMPLMLKWDREDQADSAAVRAENIDSVSIPDSGSYALAGGALKADKDQARQNTVRLTRTNRVVPSGTVAGSTWSVTIENEIDVVAAALPL